MRVSNALIEKLIFKRFYHNVRFTQDSPVYPDVWQEFFNTETNINSYRADLILTPHRKSSSSELFKTMLEGLTKYTEARGKSDRRWDMASSGDTVVACLTLDELILVGLPLTDWWRKSLISDHFNPPDQKIVPDEFGWFIELVGALYVHHTKEIELADGDEENRKLFRRIFRERFSGRSFYGSIDATLFSVSRNRQASITLEDSVPATKADAGRRLFDIDGSNIAWAVLDTGIDATHLAFRKVDSKTKLPFESHFEQLPNTLANRTRIVATYDFTKFRDILASLGRDDDAAHELRLRLFRSTADHTNTNLTTQEIDTFLAEIDADLKRGRILDWTILAPLLRVPHKEGDYVLPVHPHGTHVAGIIGAGLDANSDSDEKIIGMCPGIDLYDLRVLDGNGSGNEFNILAALQFVRWMNSQKDEQVIHGVNLSFSMKHEVASYACGQTPVCIACDQLVSNGVVVVAAAGNLGQAMFESLDGKSEQGFRSVNITDPGNADCVITVGSTHRNRPHTYGVSYFSSKGPTGDGRLKPDLVAPGEKIVSCIIGNGVQRMDGTSMAAPHVSGAAALLLAKHRELIGRPKRVKEILCNTATDLGREKYFQGRGMLDVLRAIQSI